LASTLRRRRDEWITAGVAAGLPPERVAACERAFRTNLDHELAFWDA
jgi:hypothetical protein